MPTYVLNLPAAEVVRLLKAEAQACLGQPELDVTAKIDYLIEEEFDRSAYGMAQAENFDLVASIATLTIEPRVESGYWVLETSVERALGPVRLSEEDEFAFRQTGLADFEAELNRPEASRTTVRLHVETSAIKKDFDRWLAEMRLRHPAAASA